MPAIRLLHIYPTTATFRYVSLSLVLLTAASATPTLSNATKHCNDNNINLPAEVLVSNCCAMGSYEWKVLPLLLHGVLLLIAAALPTLQTSRISRKAKELAAPLLPDLVGGYVAVTCCSGMYNAKATLHALVANDATHMHTFSCYVLWRVGYVL